MAWPIIAGLAASAIGSYLSNRAKNKQAQSQSNLYNDWLKNYQGTGQNLYNQAQQAGWNPYGPKTSTTTSSGTSNTSGSFSNRPVITEEYAPLDAMMRGIMSSRLSGGSSLPPGYASTAAQAINQSYEGADQAARNMAARRGLSAEQSYAIASPANRARAGALAQMRSNLPLLEREMQNQDIGITQGLQQAFGRGEQGRSSSMTSNQSMGQSQTPFDAGDLGQLMSVLAPPNPNQTTQTGYSAVGSGLSSIGPLLGFLAANQGQPKNTGYSPQPGEMPWGWRG